MSGKLQEIRSRMGKRKSLYQLSGSVKFEEDSFENEDLNEYWKVAPLMRNITTPASTSVQF
jgi:hypothetical protein